MIFLKIQHFFLYTKCKIFLQVFFFVNFFYTVCKKNTGGHIRRVPGADVCVERRLIFEHAAHVGYRRGVPAVDGTVIRQIRSDQGASITTFFIVQSCIKLHNNQG